VDAVNQAAMLRDGDQLHVPALAEDASMPPPGVRSAEIEIGLGGAGAPVNVNTATLEALDTLPGIGPTRAQAIIDGRPYASVDELERVPGIGPATLEQLRPFVTVE
jgi:competence protein ComEA